MVEIKTKAGRNAILSICIPTWNRANILQHSLRSIEAQIKEIDSSELELFVSDNCSDDNTQEVVKDFIQKGLPITYNRNKKNLGASGNFVRCMQWASGKYILLLGDDDILRPGSIKFLLDILRHKDYGLVHIHNNKNFLSGKETKVYDNVDEFIKSVSYFYTFVSGNIFRKDIVSEIDEKKYLNTHLLQMPFFIQSTLQHKENLIVCKDILECGLDGKNNGGYEFYEVFVKYYLSIWREFYHSNRISKDLYHFIKKDIYEKFIMRYNMSLLVEGNGIYKKNKDVEGKRGGFMVDNAWKILFINYGTEKYFLRNVITMIHVYLINKKTDLRRNISLLNRKHV